jgi:hypothetical protein
LISAFAVNTIQNKACNKWKSDVKFASNEWELFNVNMENNRNSLLAYILLSVYIILLNGLPVIYPITNGKDHIQYIPITKAWHIPRFKIQETASRYEGVAVNILNKQSTRGGPLQLQGWVGY